MGNLKKGTFFRNLWAGHETYFVYMGFPCRTGKAEAAKVGGVSLVNVDGKWLLEKAEYYRSALNDREHFPVIGYFDYKSAFINGIKKAAKIIAEDEPVRHGKWIESYAYGAWHYDCPFCDDGYATKEREEKPVNYCSNCGAKLDLEETE